MELPDIQKDLIRSIQGIDDKLSNRSIELDPEGYFLIKIEPIKQELVLEHYINNIDSQGRAVDPETGKPIDCTTKNKKKPNKIFRGRSAKEVGIQISEGQSPLYLSRLDHALYLGRELQKAEQCLKTDKEYIQD